METQIKIAFQDPDSRLFEINRLGSKEPAQVLSEEQFRKLQSLMNNTKWIIVQWAKPPDRQEILHSPGTLNESKLSDDVLNKLVSGIPLNEADKKNITDSANEN
jgi:hypothetical protein